MLMLFYVMQHNGISAKESWVLDGFMTHLKIVINHSTL